jgi:hypothetical protein
MSGSQRFKCKHCGAIHGGVDSPDVCHECWVKGLRRALHAFRHWLT